MCPRECKSSQVLPMLIDVGQTTTRLCEHDRYSRCFRSLWYCSGRGEPTGSAERRFLSYGAQKVSKPKTIS